MPIFDVRIKRNILVFLLIFVSCLIPYFNSLNNPFIWDDNALVVNNSLIKGEVPWHKAFTSDLYFGVSSGSNFYRPMQTLSYMWDYFFWQLDVRGYHLTNIILHAIVGFLVFLFIYAFSKHLSISLSGALLFTLCPLHTQSVTYISGRADILMGIFLILAFLLFKASCDSGGNIRKSYYCLSLLFFSAGLLSKELAVIFPLVILGFIFYFARGLFKKPWFFTRAALPFIIIDLIYVILRLTVFRFPTIRPPNLVNYPFLVRISVLPKVIFAYIKLLILPINLHMSRTTLRPTSDLGIALSLFFLALILFICGYILLYKRNKNIFPFMLFWFLVYLIPQSGLFPINAFVSEHFIYLSSISFFFAFAYLCNKFLRKRLFIIVTALLLVSYGLIIFARNLEWHNPIIFYQNIIKNSPDSYQAYNNLGLEYDYINKPDAAERYYQKALQIKPDLLEARSNLANLYFKLNRTEDAKKEYALIEKSAIGSKAGEIQNNIGNVLEAQGKLDEALKRYERALELDRGLSFTHFNIARIYILKKNLGLAAQEVFSSLPESGILADKKSVYLNCIVEYLKAGRDFHCASDFYNDLGVEFAQKVFYAAAISSFRRAVELGPQNASAHFNLGLAYLKIGNRNKAIAEFKSVVRIEPDHAGARGWLCEIQKKK